MRSPMVGVKLLGRPRFAASFSSAFSCSRMALARASRACWPFWRGVSGVSERSVLRAGGLGAALRGAGFFGAAFFGWALIGLPAGFFVVVLRFVFMGRL